MRRKMLAFCLLPLLLFISACEEEAKEPTDGNPTISILTPTGNELTGVVTIEVFGHDADGGGLDRIVFFVDDVAQYTDPDPGAGSPSSVWQWNSSLVNDGDYDLKVVGYDNVGRSGETERRYDVRNADEAMGVVRSNESGTISTRLGAGIRIPLGAVPLGEEGENATMVFSVGRDTSATAQPPAGETRVSNYYRFTPGGFVFRYPVEVMIPLLDGVDAAGREVTLYRINPTSGQLENFAGAYDEAFGTIAAQTYELSTWFAAMAGDEGIDAAGWGCVQVNANGGGWMSLCVESYLLANPAHDQLFMPQHGLNVVYGSDEFGWDESGRWFLPQGSYTICMQRQNEQGEWLRQSRSLVISQPAGHLWDGGTSCAAVIDGFVTNGSVPQPEIGACPCVPEASVPVGTGDIQVTLQWFNDRPIDLDLWVYEPSGERCYFGHSLTATGGTLDRDNLCGNYQNGTPENIFWQTAPIGEYSIWVDWWSDCGNGIPNQPFNVRLVNLINVETFESVLGREQSVEVAQFQVTSSGLRIAPPGALFHAAPPPRVSKADHEAIR